MQIKYLFCSHIIALPILLCK
ncbi:hypothetical protein [uncultured Cytophaga sp.]